jgi:hypothetical protein
MSVESKREMLEHECFGRSAHIQKAKKPLASESDKRAITKRYGCSHLPVFAVGFGTSKIVFRLPRFLRAVPSTSLDKSRCSNYLID